MNLLERLARIALGLFIIAFAFAMTVHCHLGLGPWHVLQQGISRRTGVSLGAAGDIMAIALTLAAFALGERIGIGTLAAVVAGNELLDLVLPITPTPHGVVLRVVLLSAACLTMALGGTLLITADLGASPLDALTIGVYRRVPGPFSATRVGLETFGFLAGWAAGGEVGVGCAIIGLGIGPSLQLWLHVLRATPDKRAATTSADTRVAPSAITALEVG